MKLSNLNIEVVIVIPNRNWYSFSLYGKTCIRFIWCRFFFVVYYEYGTVL